MGRRANAVQEGSKVKNICGVVIQRSLCSKPPAGPADDVPRYLHSTPPDEIHPPDENLTSHPIPEWENLPDEPLEGKRGMLENGLILGTFASLHVPTMGEEGLVLYDRLINLPSNDWEIYYWATEVKETPEEFDNKVMDALKE